ncbi:MAG: murein biosynthesis integral membrane protein MurJ [Gammaproteobacteria bacterium]|nr:murein biosynthesis integral membrane protein MurJ [Gammaproteobacteria bacterium]
MTESEQQKTQSSRSLLRSSGIVSFMTTISRVFGLVRDMVIAYFFGASAGADAFFLAFRIPNFFRRLFGEGAFSQAFVPVLAEYRTQKSHAEVRALVDAVSGTLGINLLAVTLIGVLGAPLVISLFALGFVVNDEVEKLALATEMLRITFPYLLLISLTAFSGAVLNTLGRFAVPAFTPVLLNVSLILCAIYLRPWLDEPVTALAWAVLIAGVAQLSFQVPFLVKEGVLPRPVVAFRHEGVKKILSLMLPALFGVSVGQINLLLDTVLASFLQTGSLSWLYYSDRLLEFPLALFGITIATVILPSLSKDHATASTEEFSHTLEWAIRAVCLIGVPASLALIYLSEPLITTIFYHGQMTQRDVTMSSMSLMAYGAGLLGHMLVKVLAPGFFSRQDTSTPVRYGVVALVSNMVLNLLLIWHLQHAGLALATSLSAFINAGLLFFGLRRAGVLHLTPGWGRLTAQLIWACAVMLALLYVIKPEQSDWLEMGILMRFMWMGGICLAGVLAYTAALRLTGFRFSSLLR